jgi:hypothetical protein
MEAYPVSAAVNSPRNDGEELVRKDEALDDSPKR